TMLGHTRKNSLFAAPAVAALVSTAAYAGDSKPVQMTDEQMDKVTAGAINQVDNGHTQVFVATGADVSCCDATPPGAVVGVQTKNRTGDVFAGPNIAFPGSGGGV